MNYYLFILLAIALLLIVLWLYKRCQKKSENKELKSLMEAIKNNITITLYNMNKFMFLPKNIKKILLDVAKKYKHNDIILLLSK
jgi:uncharacterized protein YoxC